MRLFLLAMAFMGIAINGYSQIDTSVKSGSFEGAFNTNQRVLDSPFSIPPNTANSESNIISLEKEDKPMDMTTTHGLVARKLDYKPNWRKEDKALKEEYRKNQYFGDFRSNAKSLKILCRDHEYVDGDRVSIYVNDTIVESDILLDENFKSFTIELAPGFNTIVFKALNQGASGPNTAAFSVLDEDGNLITSNMWNLATGVKASIIVVKE